MKLEIGKQYVTKNKTTIKIIDSFQGHPDEPPRYLGLLNHRGFAETFWYTPNGRLYYDGISPFDIERELKTKITFLSKIAYDDLKLKVIWPKKTLIDGFLNKPVKITIEALEEK